MMETQIVPGLGHPRGEHRIAAAFQVGIASAAAGSTLEDVRIPMDAVTLTPRRSPSRRLLLAQFHRDNCRTLAGAVCACKWRDVKARA